MTRNNSSTGAPARQEIGALLGEALTLACGLPDAGAACERLQDLALRLSEGGFRLAAVGQFKRGKSTLLNAMIGEPLLPTAAVPATAVTTFIAGGSAYGLSLRYRDGRLQQLVVADAASTAAELRPRVTETGNPDNVLGLATVWVEAPSSSLGDGLVLVDTPGIGSTHAHNTEAGRAALASCDAALIVFSADLPITATELAYLDEIRAAVPTTLVVMTKADLATADDLEALRGFLRDGLAEATPGAPVPEIWVVSARDALAAKTRQDADAFVRSGLAAFERHLVNDLVRRKAAMLSLSMAGSAALCIATLRSTIGLRIAALGLPLAELDLRIARFEVAVDALADRRRTAQDLLAGDHRRAVAALDTASEALHAEAVAVLRPGLDRALATAGSVDDARRAIAADIVHVFDRARAGLVARTRADIADAAQMQRRRIDAIVAAIADAAAEIVGSERRADRAPDQDPPLREPYWVASGVVDTLGSLTLDGILRLLPQRLRDARARRRLRAGLDAAIVRNLTSLQWALRQWLDDAVRRLGPRLDRDIDAEIAVVRSALSGAREVRADAGAEIRDETARLAARVAGLATIETALAAYGLGDDHEGKIMSDRADRRQRAEECHDDA